MTVSPCSRVHCGDFGSVLNKEQQRECRAAAAVTATAAAAAAAAATAWQGKALT